MENLKKYMFKSTKKLRAKKPNSLLLIIFLLVYFSLSLKMVRNVLKRLILVVDVKILV